MASMTIVDLPEELGLSIISWLLLDDLQRVSLACRFFNRVAHNRLQQHVELKRKHFRIDDPFQHAPSGWLQPLIALLKHDYPSTYTEELLIAQSEWYFADLPAYDDFAQSRTERRPLPFSESDMKLVRAAASASPWITSDDACGPLASAKNFEEFITEIREGDQDNILAVLAPLLPNLRRLRLPKEIDSDGIPMGSLLGIFDRIACAYGSSPLNSVVNLPFQNLQHVECIRAGVFPYLGSDLVQISSFMAIPSVRTVKLGETWEFSFDWPDRLPKSHVKHVEFVGGNVELAAIQGLARGIAGACIFKHRRRSRFGPNSTFESRWTRAQSDQAGTVAVLDREPRHWLFSNDTNPPQNHIQPEHEG